MDPLLFDVAASYLEAAAWFSAARRHVVARRIVARAAELLAGRAISCEPEPDELTLLPRPPLT